MIWFAVGAGIGILQLVASVVRQPISLQGAYPLQGLAVMAVLGAAFYGTILWLIFR